MQRGMKKIDYKRIGYHILFWIAINLVFDIIVVAVTGRPLSRTFLLDAMFFLPTDILGAYFTIYFLFPRFLLKKKYTLFSIYFILFFVLLVCLSIPMNYIGMSFTLSAEIAAGKIHFPTFWVFVPGHLLFAVISKLMIIGIVSAIKLSRVWMSSQKEQRVLEREKLETELKLKEAELNFLKSQINPHFLFNALNNLYSLTLEKSDKAPQVVLKISALLDYMLYECNVPYVDFSKEMESVTNYIDLQKIRFGSNASVNINISGETNDVKIAPLILLPFVENAFKHGLSNSAGKGNIDMDVQLKNHKLKFSIQNTFNEIKTDQALHQGIGLKNAEKRLELQYKNLHTLNITRGDGIYSVILDMDLNLEN